jgi:hypothetical protein
VTGHTSIPDATGKMMSVPQYTRTVNLSPDQQGLLNLQNQMQTNLGNLGVSQSSRLQGLLGNSLDTQGLQDWSAGKAPTTYTPDMFAAQRDQVTNAMLQRYHATADPQRAAQEASLASRGLSPGSENWGQVQDTENRADTDAALQAQIAGGQEQSRMYGLQQASDTATNDYAAFLNNLRGGQLQERQTVRNAPINEISALMSGSGVTVPQFQQFSRQAVDTAPVAQDIYSSYQAKQQQAANSNAGIFGLGSGLLSMALAPVTGGGSLFGNMMGKMV